MSTRAQLPLARTEVIAAHIEAAKDMEIVRTLNESFEEATPETLNAIIEEAAKFAANELEPLNEAMDRKGPKFHKGRVHMGEQAKATWQACVEQGWPSLDHATEFGGQGLPLIASQATQELFDRANPSFGMMLVPARSGARLINTFGTDEQKQKYLSDLALGEMACTICISEPNAGSDVGRLRTRAKDNGDGTWSITGEKCWISFGDHDLTQNLVHCLLARTDEPGSNRPELSLFMVDGGGAQTDKVIPRRIEEKLGLHGSPTCAMGFEGATGTLLGEPGRGLAHMFVMIIQMRLAVGSMGLGIGAAATDIAQQYASERLQGGYPDQVSIDQHPDIQRMLLDMVSRTELLRGMLYSVANMGDIARLHPDEKLRTEHNAFCQWMLPILKTFGGEVAVQNSSDAIQVLGGAGYTEDWPAEQLYRDARVLPIFEGTTGIQALDLVHRRVLKSPEILQSFIKEARGEASSKEMNKALDLLEDAANKLQTMDSKSGDIEAGATHFLELSIQCAAGWVASRFMKLNDDTPAKKRLKTAAKWYLDHIEARATAAHCSALGGIEKLSGFKHI